MHPRPAGPRSARPTSGRPPPPPTERSAAPPSPPVSDPSPGSAPARSTRFGGWVAVAGTQSRSASCPAPGSGAGLSAPDVARDRRLGHDPVLGALQPVIRPPDGLGAPFDGRAGNRAVRKRVVPRADHDLYWGRYRGEHPGARVPVSVIPAADQER